MNTEWIVDGDKAPDGATHASVGRGCTCWYKFDFDADTAYFFTHGQWSNYGPATAYRDGSIDSMIERPIVYTNVTQALPTVTPRIVAHEFLERGVKHMRDRAVQRDSDAGERSMARAVVAFNAQEGTNLTEAQGWRFMIQLKYARAVNGVFVADDYEDMAAYAGLAGEAAQ